MLKLRDRGASSLALFAALALFVWVCAGCSDDGTPSADAASSPVVDSSARVDSDSGVPVADAAGVDSAASGADGGARSDAADGGGDKLPLSKLTLFVSLGDSIAAGAGAPRGQGYAPLLFKNVDTAYPSWAGRDLSTRWSAAAFADHSRGGAVSKDLPGQLAKVPANTGGGDTLVVVSIGGNDLQANLLTLFDTNGTIKLAQQVVTNIKTVLAHFGDKKKYPGKVVIALFTVYDPSDGEGSIPNDKPVSGSCIGLKILGNQAMSKNLVAFNAAYRTLARSDPRLFIVDVHQAFLGHGFHHDNKSATHYDAQDPSLWFALDCIHPNPRGHHELRAAIYNQIAP